MARVCRIAPWLIGGLAWLCAVPAGAENLDAGKTPAQIFSSTCVNCHRSPRDLKQRPSAGFMREHYTTSGEEASAMSTYLANAPASEPRNDRRTATPPANQPGSSEPAGRNRRTPPAAEPARAPEGQAATPTPRRPLGANPAPVANPSPPAQSSTNSRRLAAVAETSRAITAGASELPPLHVAPPPAPPPPPPAAPQAPQFEE